MPAYVKPHVRLMQNGVMVAVLFITAYLFYYLSTTVLSWRTLSMHEIHRVRRKPSPELTPHRFDQVIENDALCGNLEAMWPRRPGDRADTSPTSSWLFVAVVSKPAHFRARQQIRSTYASVREVRGRGIRYAFFMGSPSDHALQNRLYNESADYSDIIQEEFTDGSPGQDSSRKTMMAIKWVSRRCLPKRTHFVLKVTDDVMVNPFRLVEQLMTALRVPKPSGGGGEPPHWLWCDVKTGGRLPAVDAGQVGAVNEWQDFPEEEFPTHCGNAGGLFISDIPTLRALSLAYVNASYFWHAAVHMTGTLTKHTSRPVRLIAFPPSVGVSHKKGKVDIAQTSFFFRLGQSNFYPGPELNTDDLWQAIREAHKEDLDEL